MQLNDTRRSMLSAIAGGPKTEQSFSDSKFYGGLRPAMAKAYLEAMQEAGYIRPGRTGGYEITRDGLLALSSTLETDNVRSFRGKPAYDGAELRPFTARADAGDALKCLSIGIDSGKSK